MLQVVNPRCARVITLVGITCLAAQSMMMVLAANDSLPFGIDQRIPWTTSRITGSPERPAAYRIERRFPNLQFDRPVVLTNAPGNNRLFVVELTGTLYSFPVDDTCSTADLFFDMRKSLPNVDQVFGLAFHPRFADNGLCYICYRVRPEAPDGTRVSRFRVRNLDDPIPTIDPGTEQVLLTWLAGGHNGGCLAFGPDGYLYISTGDGGPAFPPDPLKSGQDISNLLSCVLRIDVDHADGPRAYSIPADNPFVGRAGARGEIWAYGFRNPWKISFDIPTGDLWVGDVGWELWEMVYRVERGANYGWSLMEGPQPVHRERERGPTPIVPPTALHAHTESRSLTGGNVYRGSRLPELSGNYVYGDYVTGKIWGLPAGQTSSPQPRELVDTSLPIICFGVDNQLELYVVSYDGTIHWLVPNDTADTADVFPKRLSETGLFRSVGDHQVAAGVVPYSIKAEPWMDGAVAERFVALPGTTQLGLYDTTNAQVGFIKNSWRFPHDAVLMKTISLQILTGSSANLRRLETQILHKHGDDWKAYSYLWNDDQNDAVLAQDRTTERSFTVPDPTAKNGSRQQLWRFVSRTECLLCHTTRGGSIYGFNPPQLDRVHDYGAVSDNQLRTLRHIGLFQEVAKEPSYQLVNPYDETADRESRARAYLHVNCAHCHRRGGGGTAAMDVQFPLKLEKTNLVRERPTQGTFGIHSPQVVAPGDPFRSVLFYRMAKIGRGRMPYLGSAEVDREGLKLMHDWIAAMNRSSAGDNAAPSLTADGSATDRYRNVAGKLTTAPTSELTEHVRGLLQSTSDALALQRALDLEVVPDPVREQVLATARTHPDVQVRDLFERFVSAEFRTKRLGGNIVPQEILALKGDPNRGQTLFFDAATTACQNCHQWGGRGTALGPELTQIGRKYTRQQLLESILEPSKLIDPKFTTYLVETKDGRVVSGVLVSRDEQTVTLLDQQAKPVRIPTSQVEFSAPQQKSLMPELLLQDMTGQQVADLIAFLAGPVDAHQTGSVELPPKPQLHLFLLIGQSNMAGRGAVEEEDRIPHPRVIMLDKSDRWVPAVDPLHFDKPVAGVGIGKTFGIAVAEANPSIVVGLIPCAVGGSPIDSWQPGAYYAPTKSHPWDDAMRRAKTAIEAGVLKGILWHQGESDSTNLLAPGYRAKLDDLIGRLRRDLESPDVPFLAGQLGQFTDRPWDDAHRQVNEAHSQLSQRVSRTAFVRSDGLRHKGDQVHFDSWSCREFGRRYARAYFEFLPAR